MSKITGRLDFIHKDPISSSVNIFDGKGTDKLGKNISNDQVLYYCLLYFFNYKELPVETGFFYYRFNLFVPVPVNLTILNEFRSKVSLGIKQILTDTNFTPTPSAKACKYCDYRITCDECAADKIARQRPSKLKESDLTNVFLI